LWRFWRGKWFSIAKHKSMKQSEAPESMRAGIFLTFSESIEMKRDEWVMKEVALRNTSSR
jgi:hypothetical protein